MTKALRATIHKISSLWVAGSAELPGYTMVGHFICDRCLGQVRLEYQGDLYSQINKCSKIMAINKKLYMAIVIELQTILI